MEMNCTYHPQAELLSAEQMSYQGKVSHDSDVLKPHSTHATFKWLDQNYQLEEGVCLPRCTIYEHYQDFCDRNYLQPVNAASFGKIVRQHFPKLTTRRLGTRGQSKYHYYGLGIKPTSAYYPPDYVERIKQSTKKTPETRKTTSHEKPSTTLPVFPDINSLLLTDNLPIDKLKTFMVMYRAHCQRILDSVVRANFNEVENFLLHFWQGMPSHMLPVLASDVVVDLVAYCDTLLYKVICNVLITSPLQNLPESLAGEYRMFSDMLRQWLEIALKGLPESLQEAKYKVAEGFINGLRRQTSLTKLAQVAQSELRNSNSLDQLKQDWDSVDFQSVFAQTLYSIQPMKIPTDYSNLLPVFLLQFSGLLHEETGLEKFLSFAEQMVHDAIEKGTETDVFPLKDACQAFLLCWKFFNTKVLEEFTMENAPSFGFFILLHMLMDDYITHLLETKLEKEDEKIYYKRIQILEKKDGQLLNSSAVTRNSSNSSSKSDSPLPSPDEEMHVPESYDSSVILSNKGSGLVNRRDLDTSFPSVATTPLPNMYSPGLQNSFQTNETGSSLNISGTAKNSSFYSPVTPNSNMHHNVTPNIHASHKGHSDFSSLGNFPPLAIPERTLSQSSLQGFQSPSSGSVLRQTGNHLSPPGDFSASQPNIFSPNTQTSQTHDQSSILSSVPPPQSLLSSLKPQCNSFSLYSLSSSTPTFITQTSQANLGTRILSSCSLPITTPQSFSSSPHHHQHHFGQPQITQHNIIPNVASDTPTAGHTALSSSMVGRSLPSLPGFAALNVPYSHSNSTTGSNSLSLFPGMYPYTQFVGIPTQLNNPFTPAGLPMPGTQNQVPTGYPYLTNVPHSLYNPQISTTYSR